MTQLEGWQSDLLASSRRAVLATVRPNGRPRLVPIAFAVDMSAASPCLYSSLDEKRKSVSDVRRLARVRDILARPAVSVLVDRWSEDWRQLCWLRLDGNARLIEPDAADHARAVALLRERYGQYAEQRLETRPVVVVEISAISGWCAA